MGARTKCQKHGVPIAVIENLFQGNPAVYADPDHSVQEQRLRLIGKTVEGRSVLVAFTLRRRHGLTLIRPISARYMHEKEVRHYERQQAT
jgi:uncharacterized DUF497 family protein